MTAHIPRLAWGRADGWNGLADGQEWNAAPGIWQARLDPEGRAHVIGCAVSLLLQNPDSRNWREPIKRTWGRPWRAGPADYDRAMRAARLHNAMVKAANNG